MRWTFFVTQFALLVLLPIIVFAVDTVPPEAFVQQHTDVTVWVFGLLLGAVIFLLYRMISQNDKAFEQNKREHEAMLEAMKEESEKKWSAIDNLTRDLGSVFSEFNRLKGEHDVLKGVHLHRRADDN